MAQLCSGGDPKVRTEGKEAAKVSITAPGNAGCAWLHCKGKDCGIMGSSHPHVHPAAEVMLRDKPPEHKTAKPPGILNLLISEKGKT